MPRGDEVWYIDTAGAVDIMMDNLDCVLFSGRGPVPAHTTGTVFYGSEARDEYAEAIAQWRHWAGDD